MLRRVVLLGLVMVAFCLQAVLADDLTLEMIEAARVGNMDTLNWALKEGADANARDAEGRSALSEAVWNRRYPAVAMLLEAGADPNTRNSRNDGVIVAAARQGDLDVVRALIAAGANLEARDTDGVESISNQTGVTALWVAARWGMIDVVRALLDAGANPQVSDYDGIPAWAAARQYDFTEIYELLEAAGAKAPPSDDEGGL